MSVDIEEQVENPTSTKTETTTIGRFPDRRAEEGTREARRCADSC